MRNMNGSRIRPTMHGIIVVVGERWKRIRWLMDIISAQMEECFPKMISKIHYMGRKCVVPVLCG